MKGHNIFLTLCLALVVEVLLAHSAYAASAYEQNGDIVVNQNGELRKFRLPYELQRASSYAIRIEPKRLADPGGGGGGNGGGGSGGGNGLSQNPEASSAPLPTSLSSLLYRAKRLFAARKYDQAMNTLDVAEQASPQDVSVKNMKGSLFFMRGMKDEARRYWNESLELKPEQANVKTFLKKLGAAPPPTEAKLENTQREEGNDAP